MPEMHESILKERGPQGVLARSSATPCRALSFGGLWLALALWASPAHAQQAPPAASTDAARAVQLNEAGSELYAAGNYLGALQAFERAYALMVEPNLLFNIAGCHEQLGQRATALEYYRRFLAAPTADPEGRRRAVESLRQLEPAPLDAAPTDTGEPSVWDHPAWPLATLGSGILFAGLGLGLYLDGAHDHDEVTSASSYGATPQSSAMTEVEAQRLVDSGDTKKLVGGVGFGLGSALIATHVVLSLWQGSKSEGREGRAEVRLLPSGCVVTGSF
jgi:tetratricopeptide (TPR) repeat protein